MKHIYESFERIAAVSGNAKNDLLTERLKTPTFFGR